MSERVVGRALYPERRADGGRAARWLLVIAMVGVRPMGLHAETNAAPPAQPPDWPVAIAKLREELRQWPGQTEVRHQLAIAYNNYGITLGNQGQWEEAAQQLEEALRLEAANKQFRNNLSTLYLNQAYELVQRHQLAEAKQIVEQAIAVTDNMAEAYVLLGEIEYSAQRLKEAKAAWQHAIELDPRQEDALADRLERLNQELPIESKFDRLSQAYFDLRYEEQIARDVGFDIRDALLEARREVGADFAYWPKQKLVVLIYTAKSFQRIRREMPDWVGAYYDGKIRAPLPDAEFDQAAVKETLFHEYTHAVVRDLTQGKCPAWLNEGLATYEGSKQRPFVLAQLIRAYQGKRLVRWDQLSNQFAFAMPIDDVRLGYEQSYSAVDFLVSRYGFWRIRRLLKAIGAGKGWQTALADEFRMNVPKLEASWRSWLPDRLNAAR